MIAATVMLFVTTYDGLFLTAEQFIDKNVRWSKSLELEPGSLVLGELLLQAPVECHVLKDESGNEILSV